MEYAVYIVVFTVLCFTGDSAGNKNDSPRCVDQGIKYYDCATMYSWYTNRDQSLQAFCNDYQGVCCSTCASGGITSEPTTAAPVTEKQCEDTGFLTYTCQAMSLWYTSLQSFCDYCMEYCCYTCTHQIEVCEDTGFLHLDCPTLQSRLGSKHKLCNTYRPYCCITCSS